MAQQFFDVLVPNLAVDAPYAVSGTDCQVLTVQLKPNASLQSEAGAMMFMSPGVKTTTECATFSRYCAGETCCKILYTNEASKNGFVGLTPSFPAKVIPVDLSKYGESKLISKRGSYMVSVGEVETECNLDCGITGCCIQGMGCIRSANRGNGTVFLAAGGTILCKELGAGEEIIVDSDSIVGFKDSVKLGWRCNGGPLTWCFGGEGCCNLTVTGPGLVMIQSMSLPKYLHVMRPPMEDQGKDAGAGN